MSALRTAHAYARRRLIGAAVAGAGAAAWSLNQTAHAQLLEPAAPKKTVHEVSLLVSSSVEGDFHHWLPPYLKKLLELPGLLGAKVLQPATHDSDLPAVVFVLGGPGAGKGTQCSKIVDEYGYVHLSAGDLLRAEKASGSAQGQMISEYIREGKIVPVEVTVKLLVDAMKSDGGKRFLVDGFPRNANNLSGWQQVAGSSLHVAGVLVYDCPEEVMEARLLERGKTSGRSDDNIDSIRKRFHTFEKETKPVLDYYKHQGLLHTIDGTRPVAEVWADSQAFVRSLDEELASRPSALMLHVFSTAAGSPALAERISSDMAARWGEGAVSVSVTSFPVQHSFKAFDLDALRAFD
eukprot:CAMPEP_0183352116 /NCGR_PEP_ID=MMETSP0164_2-20130417/27632_1 /TAXON_ID=221442 /ORGANISM="Coccolithus pelagicus ssp braarudi, Strain PLY182g" /LENGTH=349 /DNA_ID=CAMNT_0025524475 /DNA_START=6 /DNA_END=1055 /DNA_ORIENTATION=+